MSRSLLVLGAGGHGRVVADAALLCGFEHVAFLDDTMPETELSGPFQIIGRLSDLESLAPKWEEAFVGIGDNTRRVELFDRLRRAKFRRPSLCHPAAVISRHAVVGEGVVVAAGAVINIGARIGDAAIVNTAATVDHDCVIGAGVHISPGAHVGGNVVIGDGSWIGIGAAIRNGVKIGAGVVVGAGAAVVRDLPEAAIYAGVPAKRLPGKPLR